MEQHLIGRQAVVAVAGMNRGRDANQDELVVFASSSGFNGQAGGGGAAGDQAGRY
jgi:hypothetical protein